MWCSTCQQDVPGLGSPRSAVGLCCGKCGESLASGTATGESHSSDAIGQRSAAKHRPSATALIEDDWALEAELRGIERFIGSLKSAGGAGGEMDAIHRLDQAGLNRPGNGSELREFGAGGARGSSPSKESAASKRHLAAWLILSIGVAMLACGSVLLLWSLVAGRNDLCPMGMPLAVIGQAGLILGFMLQLGGEPAAAHQATTGRSTMPIQARQDTLHAYLSSGDRVPAPAQRRGIRD